MNVSTLSETILVELKAGLPHRFDCRACDTAALLAAAIDWWLDNGGSPEAWVNDSHRFIAVPEDDSPTLLLLACDQVMVDQVRRLLAAGADPNRADAESCVPLLQIDACLSAPRIGPLFSYRIPDLKHTTPEADAKRIARYRADAERCLDLLLSHGAHDLRRLRAALLDGDWAAARALLAGGFSPAVRPRIGLGRAATLLDLCVRHNRPEAVSLLIKHGARPHHYDTLHELAKADALDCIEPLLPAYLQEGLARQEFNAGVLRHTVMIEPALRWWLAHGGSPDAVVPDSYGTFRQPYSLLFVLCDCACAFGVELLLQHGADATRLEADHASPILQLDWNAGVWSEKIWNKSNTLPEDNTTPDQLLTSLAPLKLAQIPQSKITPNTPRPFWGVTKNGATWLNVETS